MIMCPRDKKLRGAEVSRPEERKERESDSGIVKLVLNLGLVGRDDSGVEIGGVS